MSRVIFLLELSAKKNIVTISKNKIFVLLFLLKCIETRADEKIINKFSNIKLNKIIFWFVYFSVNFLIQNLKFLKRS